MVLEDEGVLNECMSEFTSSLDSMVKGCSFRQSPKDNAIIIDSSVT